MAKPPDLTSLPLGTRVQDPFVVLDVSNRASEESPFTILTVGNATGRMDSAPFWLEDQPRIAGIHRGTVVQLIGEVTQYRDRRQLKVSSIRVLPPEAVEWSALVPGVGDPTPWWDALDRWRADIAAPRLRTALGLFFEDEAFRQVFAATPASLSGPHARRGGLLKLTAEVVAAARPLARMSGADLDVTVSGALLHGVGCTECFTATWPFSLTDCGALSAPSIAGARLLESRWRAGAPTPGDDRELLLLQHLILAAAPTGLEPTVLEAEVVRLASDAARRVATAADTGRRAADFGRWSHDGGHDP